MIISDIDAYGLVIGGSLIIILSYFANLLAKRTNIPSVLVLIAMGIAARKGLETMGLKSIPYEGLVLELLGTVGLIFIVLEAALDLELTRAKRPLILKSASVALLALVGSSLAIAGFLSWAMAMPFVTALVYAIPLSIMSSAIIIPSVGGLHHDPKEFMVYESTFSDIFGIMAFYLVLENAEVASTQSVLLNVASNLLTTIVLAVIVSYILVWVLQKITSPVKLFLSIAVLLLIYSIQKLLHLSPLILILIFGLMLKNYKLFFPRLGLFRPRKSVRDASSDAKNAGKEGDEYDEQTGWLAHLLDEAKMTKLHNDYHLLTLESAFVIRTFFFVIFGMTVSIASLANWDVVADGLLICVMLFSVRFFLLLFFKRKAMFPLLYIAPRGLITILLFFQIQSSYSEYLHPAFDQGILLVVILVTSVIMTIALVQHGMGLKEIRRESDTAALALDDEDDTGAEDQ
jgi:Kef-type K+ transport system membrane component KefB